MKLKHWLRLLGPVIFLYILSKVNLESLKEIFKLDISYLRFAFALLLYLVFLVFDSFRIKVLYHIINVKIKLKEMFTILMASQYIALASPGNIGGLVKLVYIKEICNSWLKCIIGFIAEKFLDLFMIAILGAIGVCLIFPQNSFKLGLLIAVVLGLLFILVIYKNKILDFIIKLTPKNIKRIVEEKILTKFKLKKDDFNRMIVFVKGIQRRKVFELMLVYTLSWFFYCYVIYLVSLSWGIKVPFYIVLLAVPASYIALIIPITFAGLGTREAALIFILTRYGFNYTQGLSFSFIFLIFLLINLIIGLICWIIKPVNLNKKGLDTN